MRKSPSFYSLPSCSSMPFCTLAALIHVCLLPNLVSANGLEPAHQLQPPGFEPVLQLHPAGLVSKRPRSSRVVYVEDHGAKGDGLTDDTQAFMDAWNLACSSSSRARIVVQAGSTYLVRQASFTGPCRSRLTFRISGTIIAPRNPDAWDGRSSAKWLVFSEVYHLTVDGRGTVDGMGDIWWSRSCKINKTNPCHSAPTAITFHSCNNLKFRDLMVKNGQQAHVTFNNSTHVSVSSVKVLAPRHSPNTDGLHVSNSTRVEIKNSIVGTGDDCVSIVSNSSKIKIKNLACGPGHGISIGSLGKAHTYNYVRDVTVDGAVISNTSNGVRIKTWQGGHGFASNIVFRNVWMDDVSNPIIIDQYYCDKRKPCANETLAVKVKDISFEHIKGTSATKVAIKFACSDSVPCEGIHLKDVKLESSSGGDSRSFCHAAYGSSDGVIYPPSCLSNRGRLEGKREHPIRAILESVAHSLMRLLYRFSSDAMET